MGEIIIRPRIFSGILCLLLMAVLPLLSFANRHENTGSVSTSAARDSSEDPESKTSIEEKITDSTEQSFIILDTSTGNTVTIPDHEFCIGALAFEMPPTFEKEALKAQTVALYTHFCRIRENERKNPDPSLNGADFKADLSAGEFYLSDELMQKKWGELYKQSKSALQQAADECYGLVLTDGSGKLIDAAYHAISGGITEDSKDIFGFESPYLKARPSPGDTQAPDYLTERSFSADEFSSKILSARSSAVIPGKPEKYCSKPRRTSSGTVLEIVLCGEKFTGQEVRSLFGLRSADFEITLKGGTFIFRVKGYGHGVGLSQYGAESMASQGADFKEILNWYYSNAPIEKLNSKIPA